MIDVPYQKKSNFFEKKSLIVEEILSQKSLPLIELKFYKKLL